MPAKWHNEINKRKTLHQIKKKGSGAVGKEKDEKTGILCAGFSAISSFLVYYSQEVRFYSVLFLFSALGLLYLIKSVKHPNKKNFILYAIFNSLILFTHTIGFVFVFFNLVFLSINLSNSKNL